MARLGVIEKLPVTTWLFEEGTFVPAAKLTANKKLSIVANYMGTPEAMYDSEGKKSWSCELNSYGKVRNFEGEYKTDCPFRYQGQYEDAETGLYYNRFRYYSPDEGIYLSQDPIGLNGGLSLYSYVQDTNNWIDPYGLIATNDKGINGAGYDIYVIKDSSGKVIYVGETNDFERRKAEHEDSRRYRPEDGMSLEQIDHTKTYGEARGYEQYYIDKHKTVNTENRGKYDSDKKIIAGTESNRANSYDKQNRIDDRAKEFNKGYEDVENKRGKLCQS